MSPMASAYIVDAVRTPVGRRKGGLAAVHPVDLGAHVLEALVRRTGIDPAAVDDVVFGCLDQIGPQSADIARTCWLAAGLPVEVPGTTVDRQCGSSQQAVHFAAQGIMSGTQDLVIAGGVQNMSQVPIGSATSVGSHLGLPGDPYTGSERWAARYGNEEISQFRGAELVAQEWDISREDMERFALLSHQRAIRAQDEGRFDRETIRYGDVIADEGPRRDTSLEKMAALPPLSPGGRITAAVSSQISDAAAALLIASEPGADRPWPHPPGADPSPIGARRRSGLHADRADLGDAPGTGQGRHAHRRHRPSRDQRGVRARRARLAAGDQG